MASLKSYCKTTQYITSEKIFYKKFPYRLRVALFNIDVPPIPFPSLAFGGRIFGAPSPTERLKAISDRTLFYNDVGIKRRRMLGKIKKTATKECKKEIKVKNSSTYSYVQSPFHFYSKGEKGDIQRINYYADLYIESRDDAIRIINAIGEPKFLEICGPSSARAMAAMALDCSVLVRKKLYFDEYRFKLTLKDYYHPDWSLIEGIDFRVGPKVGAGGSINKTIFVHTEDDAIFVKLCFSDDIIAINKIVLEDEIK